MSNNSGEEIYNKVIVEGTGPDGTPLSVTRYAGQQAGVLSEVVSSPALINPSFATNTTGWTASGGGTITRDTGVFHSSPASGFWDNTSEPLSRLSAAFTGTFERGVTYTLEFRGRAFSSSQAVFARFGALSALDFVTSDQWIFTNGGFEAAAITWTPEADRSGVTIEWFYPTGEFYFDSLELRVAKPTLLDRRGLARAKSLPVNAGITAASGQRLGDLWLSGHTKTPFKGEVTVSRGGVRKSIGGEEVHPAHLLTYTGELMRFADRIDPDTGAAGRLGKISTVRYVPSEGRAYVGIDNENQNFEALLARLTVVTGGG